MSSSNTCYSVYYYVNGERTGTYEHVTAEQAYAEAVPGEALFPNPHSRWHVLMRMAAMERMRNLAMGEELPISWQDEGPPGFDTERIVIVKEYTT
jgi:hypothetical protein